MNHNTFEPIDILSSETTRLNPVTKTHSSLHRLAWNVSQRQRVCVWGVYIYIPLCVFVRVCVFVTRVTSEMRVLRVCMCACAR